MDQRLVTWARAVKSRNRHLGRHLGLPLPPLWLFSDAERMPALLDVVSTLPAGLCGVVFRHDGVDERVALARSVWRICRTRRLAMTVAGEWTGFAGPGRHLRAGWGVSERSSTSSAHTPADIVRARRAGCGAVFLSPVFPTASHPGAGAMGPVRWAGFARGSPLLVMALGGIDGWSVQRLPRWASGAGAIGALSPGERR